MVSKAERKAQNNRRTEMKNRQYVVIFWTADNMKKAFYTNAVNRDEAKKNFADSNETSDAVNMLNPSRIYEHGRSPDKNGSYNIPESVKVIKN